MSINGTFYTKAPSSSALLSFLVSSSTLFQCHVAAADTWTPLHSFPLRLFCFQSSSSQRLWSCDHNGDVAQCNSEKPARVGTPHPRRSPLCILNEKRRDVWDYSHRRNLNPLTSCSLMRSLVSVGASVICLLSNSRLTAGQRGGDEGRNGTCSGDGGVDDRLMWGVGGGGGGERPSMQVSSEPGALGGAQHVFMLWRGLSLL